MEQRQKRVNKQKTDTLPPSTKTTSNNKDPKQKRQPSNPITPSTAKLLSNETAINKEKTSSTSQPTKLPFNVPNEVLNLSASEDLSKKFAKRELVKNWDKYDKEIIEIDNEQLNAADFEKILAAPSSIGNHFVFNSEKNWQTNLNDNDDASNQTTASSLAKKYFNLNIMELTNNLQRLPFYVRQNYSTDLFTKKEIDEMNRKANLLENSNAKIVDKVDEISSKMLNILSDREEKPKTAAKVKVCQSPVKVIPSQVLIDDCMVDETPNILESNDDKTESDDELETLLGLSLQSAPIKIDLSAAKIIDHPASAPKIVEENTLVSTTIETDSVKIVETKEDIQKWLDDILD